MKLLEKVDVHSVTLRNYLREWITAHPEIADIDDACERAITERWPGTNSDELCRMAVFNDVRRWEDKEIFERWSDPLSWKASFDQGDLFGPVPLPPHIFDENGNRILTKNATPEQKHNHVLKHRDILKNKISILGEQVDIYMKHLERVEQVLKMMEERYAF